MSSVSQGYWQTLHLFCFRAIRAPGQPALTLASSTGKGGTGEMLEASRINRRDREWQESRLAGQLGLQPASPGGVAQLLLLCPGLARWLPEAHSHLSANLCSVSPESRARWKSVIG